MGVTSSFLSTIATLSAVFHWHADPLDPEVDESNSVTNHDADAPFRAAQRIWSVRLVRLASDRTFSASSPPAISFCQFAASNPHATIPFSILRRAGPPLSRLRTRSADVDESERHAIPADGRPSATRDLACVEMLSCYPLLSLCGRPG